jgi:hypothetical protein
VGKGGSRVGAGRKRLPLQEHMLRGSYRPDRHGPLPASGNQRSQPAFDWQPSAQELDRLGPAGKAFLAEALEKREWNFAAGHVLISMASEVDLLAVIRKDIDTHGILVPTTRGTLKAHPLLKEHLRASKWLGQMLRQLNL